MQQDEVAVLQTGSYKFDDLQLASDHRLQIEIPNTSTQAILARYLGHYKGGSLLVRLPNVEPDDAVLKVGDMVDIRGFSGRVAFTFSSKLLSLNYDPYVYCHLSFPEAIEGTEIRKAARVKTSFPAMVTNLNPARARTVGSVIENISTEGALISCEESIGAAGDEVEMSFKFLIAPNQYEVNLHLNAVVLPSVGRKGEDGSRMAFGVKFTAVRSSEAIMMQNLIYQLLQEKN